MIVSNDTIILNYLPYFTTNDTIMYKPPYSLTNETIEKSENIVRLIGQIEGNHSLKTDFRLRRQNKIKSLHSSLAIEGNSLTIEQVTALLDGKLVLGPPRDILEVQNAIKLYDALPTLSPFSEESLLKAHEILMSGLLDSAGRYRSSGVGVFDGSVAVHIAPPQGQVPRLMGQLFDYLSGTPELTIIKSCVFHYEFEFIHPFADGNGRMGRLWQTAILAQKYPVLIHVPVESVVYRNQQAYYDALRQSGQNGNSDVFINYMLDIIHTSLKDVIDTATYVPTDAASRLKAYRESLTDKNFQRKDYSFFFKNITSTTASRDLRKGVDDGILNRTGDKRTTTYNFI